MKNQRGYPHGKDKHVERKKRVDERAETAREIDQNMRQSMDPPPHKITA